MRFVIYAQINYYPAATIYSSTYDKPPSNHGLGNVIIKELVFHNNLSQEENKSRTN